MIVPWYQLWMLGIFVSKSWLLPWRSQLKLGSQQNHHETPKRIAEPAWDFVSMLILCFDLKYQIHQNINISFHIHFIRTEPSKYQISMLISMIFIGRNPLKSTEIHEILQTCTASQGQTAAAKGGAVLVRWRSGFDTKIPMDMNQYLMFVLENIWYGQYLDISGW